MPSLAAVQDSRLGVTRFRVWGTTAVLVVTDPAALPHACRILRDELAAFGAACDRFRDDSELTRVNAADGAPVRVSPLLADIVTAALRAARLTGGDVDPTVGRALIGAGYDRDFAAMPADGPAVPATKVPGWTHVTFCPASRTLRLPRGTLLDLGATAKAYAADHAVRRIRGSLGCGTLVGLGGDICAAGSPPPGGWQVRVTDDHAASPEVPGQVIAISGGGLATSSTTVRAWRRGGRRLHHIIDPATGQPASGCWRTASVAAATCADANAAATAAIIRGTRAAGWLAGLGLPARLVGHDGSVTTVAGWPADPGAPGSRPAAGAR
ncbi:MAG TPA: FAD:protein FMN transferase [Streptosporangiaceae bacterium]|nr:FAD:protein FMN transferase [Streptosporangiaceae bacterium]